MDMECILQGGGYKEGGGVANGIELGRRYAAGKNISFQARTFCSVPERFVPSVHF